MFCTPLVVTKTAAAAFHDKLVLFFCCASFRFHTGNLHSYSKTLAFIVSSTDTIVKCWHLSSIIYNYGKFCDDFKSTLKLGTYCILKIDLLLSYFTSLTGFRQFAGRFGDHGSKSSRKLRSTSSKCCGISLSRCSK